MSYCFPRSSVFFFSSSYKIQSSYSLGSAPGDWLRWANWNVFCKWQTKGVAYFLSLINVTQVQQHSDEKDIDFFWMEMHEATSKHTYTQKWWRKTNTFEKENENNIYGFESIEIIKNRIGDGGQWRKATGSEMENTHKKSEKEKLHVVFIIILFLLFVHGYCLTWGVE